MNPIRFSGNFRLVQNGRPITDSHTARQAFDVLSDSLGLNGAAIRLQKPTDKLICWQGNRPPNWTGGGNNALEFRVFTEETVNQIHSGHTTGQALTEKPADGDIEVTQLLNPTLTQQLFSPKTYRFDATA